MFAICSALVMGCQMSPSKQFNKVSVGMEKDQVLEIMGSPQQTLRRSGADRWTYVFYNTETQESRQVHFSEGKAIYVGEVYKPEVSAEDQDTMNAQSNAALEAQWQQERIKRAKAPTYEETVKGTHEIRYAPSFVPVQ
ncbi:MAG: outer membrane protein assembly factor BamE [Proteobacteria bacterium]|jgi:outer membrane protein assembly factor BamE|nr:outer membrane protein assembly factor BamE [Pseudomonadota bacterium]